MVIKIVTIVQSFQDCFRRLYYFPWIFIHGYCCSTALRSQRYNHSWRESKGTISKPLSFTLQHIKFKIVYKKRSAKTVDRSFVKMLKQQKHYRHYPPFILTKGQSLIQTNGSMRSFEMPLSFASYP